MRRFPIAIVLLLPLALSCSGAPTAAPGAPATFTQVYAHVIETRCGPCHTTPNGQGITLGRLDLTSQAVARTNIVNVPAATHNCAGKGALVAPGKLQESVFYLKVSLDDPSPCGEKMPLGAVLTREEANAIAGWIAAGARDD